MTRQDISDQITERLRAFEGSGMDGSPASLQRDITAITDEMADLSKGVYLDYMMDLVTGKAVYCATPLLKIAGAQVLDAAGNVRRLDFLSARDLVDRTDARSSAPSRGTPGWYTSQGTNRIELYPVPNYGTAGNATTRTGFGLIVEGWGVPGETWPKMTDRCPLPESKHMGVVYGVLVSRCLDFPELLGKRLPGYMQKWRWYKGRMESQVALQTRADSRRMRDHDLGDGGSVPDPLDNGGGFVVSGSGGSVFDGDVDGGPF